MRVLVFCQNLELQFSRSELVRACCGSPCPAEIKEWEHPVAVAPSFEGPPLRAQRGHQDAVVAE
eukprot:1893601-Lingulodinium_polyedra.AAC.1